MSGTRTLKNLVTTLENSTFLETYRSSSQSYLSHQLANRVFNAFSLTIQTRHSEQFKLIYTNIKSISFTEDDKPQLSNKTNKIEIENWAKELIYQACEELLDSNGMIKLKLIQLLGWEKYFNTFDPVTLNDIVYSYVFTLIEQIMTSPSAAELINRNTNPLVLTAFSYYLNRNLYDWVTTIYKEKYTIQIPLLEKKNVSSQIIAKKTICETPIKESVLPKFVTKKSIHESPIKESKNLSSKIFNKPLTYEIQIKKLEIDNHHVHSEIIESNLKELTTAHVPEMKPNELPEEDYIVIRPEEAKESEHYQLGYFSRGRSFFANLITQHNKSAETSFSLLTKPTK